MWMAVEMVVMEIFVLEELLDSNGDWCICFAANLGTGMVLEAELWVCFMAISWNAGFNVIEVGVTLNVWWNWFPRPYVIATHLLF